MKEKPRDKKVTSESEALADDMGKRMRKGEKEGASRPTQQGRKSGKQVKVVVEAIPWDFVESKIKEKENYAGSLESSLLSSAWAAFERRFSAGPVFDLGLFPSAASL